MSKRVKNFFQYWLPPILWMGVIYFLSSQSGGETIFLSPGKTFLRKSFHVFEFGLLALLLWRLIYSGCRLSLKKSFWLTFFFTALLAAGDEFHQHFVNNRNGNWLDWALDSLAALFCLQALRFFWGKRKGLIFSLALLILALVFSLMGYMISETVRLKEIYGPSVARQVLREKMPAELGDKKEGIGLDESEKEENLEEQSGQEEESGDGDRPEKSGSSDAENSDLQTDSDSQKQAPTQEQKEKEDEALPRSVKLRVPFTSQAPFANWDETHEEACEEASLLMMKRFLEGDEKKTIDKDEAEAEIQKMKDFQIKRYGKFEDSTMAELKILAEELYGIKNLKVVYDFSEDDLKKELARGGPVIVPTAGRELGNPFFTGPGPLYHNLIVIGYKRNKFIANDPGTRRGRNFIYDSQVLYKAIHDFPGDKNKIKEGRKAMIVAR